MAKGRSETARVTFRGLQSKSGGNDQISSVLVNNVAVGQYRIRFHMLQKPTEIVRFPWDGMTVADWQACGGRLENIEENQYSDNENDRWYVTSDVEHGLGMAVELYKWEYQNGQQRGAHTNTARESGVDKRSDNADQGEVGPMGSCGDG